MLSPQIAPSGKCFLYDEALFYTRSELRNWRARYSVQHDLINVEAGIHDTSSLLAGQNSRWTASMRRLTGGLSDGVDVVTLDNGRMSLEILPTRAEWVSGVAWLMEFQ